VQKPENDLPQAGPPFRLGDWFVEPALNRISRDGSSYQLALKVMDVLVFLAEHAGTTMPKHHIIDAVWRTEFITENTLTQAIADLRRVLGDNARDPQFIDLMMPLRSHRRPAYRVPSSSTDRRAHLSQAKTSLEERPTLSFASNPRRSLATTLLSALPLTARPSKTSAARTGPFYGDLGLETRHRSKTATRSRSARSCSPFACCRRLRPLDRRVRSTRGSNDDLPENRPCPLTKSEGRPRWDHLKCPIDRRDRRLATPTRIIVPTPRRS